MNKFEFKLIRENKIKKETLSIKASFKILENCQTIKSNRKIQKEEIETIYHFYLRKKNNDYSESENIEILVQE